jgi:hypothetical protein
MAETLDRRNPAKERFWRDAIGRQRTSGLSIAEFCLRERLSRASFHNWRREIARRDAVAPAKTIAAKASRRTSSKAAVSGPQSVSAFVPVVVKDEASPAVVEVILPDRTLVRVSSGCDGRTLALVLAALAEQRRGAAEGLDRANGEHGDARC